jgi:uncharacterized glyoxalase superfamily protein PhnB
MKEPPKGWPRISSSLFYNDAHAAIDWLCRVFGFEVILKVEGEGGRIEHSELGFGGGLVMVGQVDADRKGRQWCKSPAGLDGANTQALCVHVENVDRHCEHARTHGATIGMEPETHDYGDDYWSDRTYEAVDLEGHHWWFIERLKTGRG